jgi:phage terminase small subunit
VNAREKAFINAYCGKCLGNASASAIAAGYSKKTSRQQGARLLTKANIKAAIAKRQDRAEQSAIADADERDRILSEIARGPGKPIEQILAIKELNKCAGRHSSTVNVNGRLTLEDALAASRD